MVNLKSSEFNIKTQSTSILMRNISRDPVLSGLVYLWLMPIRTLTLLGKKKKKQIKNKDIPFRSIGFSYLKNGNLTLWTFSFCSYKIWDSWLTRHCISDLFFSFHWTKAQPGFLLKYNNVILRTITSFLHVIVLVKSLNQISQPNADKAIHLSFPHVIRTEGHLMLTYWE